MLQFPFIPSADNYATKIQHIEVLSQVLKNIPVPHTLKTYIFHQQTLKSALFSARIEGNTLTLETTRHLDLKNPQEKQKKEISNVVKAFQEIHTISSVTLEKLRKIHAVIMKGLDSGNGSFRSEASAIYDSYGTIVYLTPEPLEMIAMLRDWLEQINLQVKSNWKSHLLQIAASHYYFEKIHPFIDGNGRTGRIMVQWQLQRLQIFADYVIPVDQFFDDHRSEYYSFLEKNSRNVQDFTDFFLDAIIWAGNKVLEDIKQSSNTDQRLQPAIADPIQKLAPRRQEIYYIIQDHPHASFDSIARRFPTIPRRTLSYDVQQLIKQNLIIKQGETRGVVYVVTKSLN